MARALGEHRALLVAFLKLFGVEETTAQEGTEGLEHYIDTRTVDLLTRFVKYVNLIPNGGATSENSKDLKTRMTTTTIVFELVKR